MQLLWITGKIVVDREEQHAMNTSNRENGQSLLEYALIIVLVAIIVIIVIYLFGPAIGNMYSNIIQNI